MVDTTQAFILIVDNNPVNLSVLSKALKAAGYKVRMATDGKDALHHIEHALPELILLDIQMPHMDGFEVCRRLQENPVTQGIPIIFMTALADSENKVKGLSLGAVDYIAKPFEQTEVLARVNVHWRLKQFTDSLEQQVHERSQALKQAQVQLVQREKLSALGELIAGVAHEINNPIGCIVGNVGAAENYMADLLGIIDDYQAELPAPSVALSEKLEDIDLTYVRTDLPNLMRAMRDSGDRIKAISRSLRTFSRSDSDTPHLFSLQAGIESALLILGHRLKASDVRPKIKVITHYNNIPEITCFAGQINQVFLNVLANAIDALEEASCNSASSKPDSKPKLAAGEITIRTDREGEWVKVAIADNGPGIPDAAKSQIFEHLFTTKAVDKGTGLGLAISRQIIVDKHHGRLTMNSTVGTGTEFLIELPI